MTNHPIVTEHPAVKAALDEEAKLEAAHQAHRQRIEAVMAPYRAALADWEQERRTALLAGKEPPQRPAEPDVGDVADENLFVQEHARLREQTRQVIAEVAPEIETRFADWEVDWRRRGMKPVAELQRLTAEGTDALNALRHVRAIVDGSNPNVRPLVGTGLAERTRQSIDAADVVTAIARGDSVLAPEPLTLVGQAVAEHSGYQMKPGRPFGTPPDMTPQRRQGAAYI